MRILSILSTLLISALAAGQTTFVTPGRSLTTDPQTPSEAISRTPFKPKSVAPTTETTSPSTEDPSSASAPQTTKAFPQNPPVSEASPEAATEFEQFVETTVGHALPVFGRELFTHVPSTFAPVDRVPVPVDYVVGPGDELLLRVWGKIDIDAHLVVDRNGQVFLPKVGTIRVSGTRYEQLPSYLHSVIARLYKDFDLNVTLGQLRSIQIFVLGEAHRPGTYTVSSLSSLINALFSSGGPSSTGSMRHIQLKRHNQTVADMDLYDLLLKGDRSADMQLQPGDIIYIPRVGPRVAAYGSVNKPAIYELRASSTLGDAVDVAGGLSNTASTSRAVIERIDEHRSRTISEFGLDDESLRRSLRDADVVHLFPVSPRFSNAVTLRGNVAQPGRYAWHESMRVSDLVPSRDALITREYWNKHNALGNTAEAPDGRLDSPDQLVTTAARTEVQRNNSEINWDHAVIERMSDGDLSTLLIPFNLANAIDTPWSTDNQPLSPGDVVTIFSRADIPVSVEKQTKFVRLEGEFNAPGVYRVQNGETLRQLVYRAGGLTSHAYPFAAEFTRMSVLQEQEARMGSMLARMERDLTARAATMPSMGSDEAVQYKVEIERQRDLMEKLRQLHPSGRVVLGMPPSALSNSELPDIAFEDGDRVYVPPVSGTVDVFGAVNNENSERYRREVKISEYLQRAGGATSDGDLKRMFVIRADGSVVARNSHGNTLSGSFSNMELLPGDAIVVPTKFHTFSLLRGLKDWSQIFTQFALGAAAIKVLQ